MKKSTKIFMTGAAGLLGAALATGGAYAATASLMTVEAPVESTATSTFGPAYEHASATGLAHANPNARGLFGCTATQAPAMQLPTTQLPTTQLPTTQLPTTQLPTVVAPDDATAAEDDAVTDDATEDDATDDAVKDDATDAAVKDDATDAADDAVTDDAADDAVKDDATEDDAVKVDTCVKTTHPSSADKVRHEKSSKAHVVTHKVKAEAKTKVKAEAKTKVKTEVKAKVALKKAAAHSHGTGSSHRSSGSNR